MLNILTYTDYNEDGIFGNLLMESGTKFSILTHAFIDQSPPYPATQPDAYICRRGMHQLEHGDPFETFEVTNVQGHTGILFHKGNWNKDSEGCFLLGEHRTDTMITESAVAFTQFMKELEGIDEFTLVIKGK